MKTKWAQNREQRSEHFYRNLKDDELRYTVQFYMRDTSYKEDKYTDMIKGILQRSSWTQAQRDAIITHLCKHENDFA